MSTLPSSHGASGKSILFDGAALGIDRAARVSYFSIKVSFCASSHTRGAVAAASRSSPSLPRGKASEEFRFLLPPFLFPFNRLVCPR